MLLGSGTFFGGAGGGGGPATDPYFANVVLLCGFNGTDGATTAPDESLSAKTLTFVGDAQIDTARSKFDGASLLLDGTGDRVTVPDSLDWDLSDANSDQFTVECWIYPTVGNTTQYLIAQSGNIGNWSWGLGFSDLTIFFQWSPNGTTPMNSLTYASPTMSLNAWHHACVDKDATGKIRLYVDGVMRASSTPANSAFFNSTATLQIGAFNAANFFNGSIDEARITKGVARYASDSGFTVPTEAFPRS
ncbi:LamG domain-containing protein [Mesorhizobium waimense]|uniref:LamG domain-containing protein n=1 Tax=Mesorhizobium waimense TaxID=1300307 RepID=A0A3A5KLX1_9HYPH|nr:LamG domain-containing protein [Mesorhizobium waimense]RJT32101.1 LamG domain-containing protein [Mesorhizobium waimense]